MNKKVLVIIAVLVISAICIGIFNFKSNHLFNIDGSVKKGKKYEFVEMVTQIEDIKERQNVLEFGVKSGTITQEEAEKLKTDNSL